MSVYSPGLGQVHLPAYRQGSGYAGLDLQPLEGQQPHYLADPAPDVIENQEVSWLPSPQPRSNRFCCLRVMDRVGSCLSNLCRKISRCFTAFLRGFTRFFKTLCCSISSNRPFQTRNARQTAPVETPPSQPVLEIDGIEPFDQQEEPDLPILLHNFDGVAREELIRLLEMSSPQDQIRVLRGLPLPEGGADPEAFICQITNEITAIPVRDRCASNDNQGCLFERTSVIHHINEAGYEVLCPFTRRAWEVNRAYGEIQGISGEFRIDRPLQQRILHWLKEQQGFLGAAPIVSEEEPAVSEEGAASAGTNPFMLVAITLRMNQFIERCVNLRGEPATAEISREYLDVWQTFCQYSSREEKLACLNQLPPYIQIGFLNHNLHEDVKRPDEFQCPITCDMMTDPHRAECDTVQARQGRAIPNHVFERVAITNWLQGHDICPVERSHLDEFRVERDGAMRNRILTWLKEQHDIIPASV